MFQKKDLKNQLTCLQRGIEREEKCRGLYIFSLEGLANFVGAFIKQKVVTLASHGHMGVRGPWTLVWRAKRVWVPSKESTPHLVCVWYCGSGCGCDLKKVVL